MSVTLQNDRVALTLLPDFGGRITALVDRATGRQWLVSGPAEAPNNGAYLGEEARGWDECFPTVSPGRAAGWGALRDHGLLWGRPAAQQGGETRWEGTGWLLLRRLSLTETGVVADYRLANTGGAAFDWMWSQHCLLDLAPGERLSMSGLEAFDWPVHPRRDLSVVGEVGEGLAIKAYALATGRAKAAVTGPRGGLAFAWESAEIGAFGLWLDYGGWPEGAPVHQLALEPTTGPADDLASAVAARRHRRLEPDAEASWRVTLTFLDPED